MRTENPLQSVTNFANFLGCRLCARGRAINNSNNIYRIEEFATCAHGTTALNRTIDRLRRRTAFKQYTYIAGRPGLCLVAAPDFFVSGEATTRVCQNICLFSCVSLTLNFSLLSVELKLWIAVDHA